MNNNLVSGEPGALQAEKFLEDLKQRFSKFALQLHPEKTRLIDFGRFAAKNRRDRDEGKPETFNFLGFTHICGKTRGGKFTVLRKTIRKKLTAKLKKSEPSSGTGCMNRFQLRGRIYDRWSQATSATSEFL